MLDFIAGAKAFCEDFLINKVAGEVIEDIQKKELKDKIDEFINRFYDTYIKQMSLDQEIDFGGLNEYLEANLENRILPFFYLSSSGEESLTANREKQKNSIYECAYEAAKADKQCKRTLVRNYIDQILKIVDTFLLQYVTKEDSYLANRMNEDLKKHITLVSQESTSRINAFTAYRGSFAEFLDNIKERQTKRRAYHYLNPDIGFYGRSMDIAYLDNFLDDERDVLFTVITGPGGIGKSKLLYQYMTMNHNNPYWKIVFPEVAQMEYITEHFVDFSYDKNVMIVVDYAGRIPEIIKTVLEKIGGTSKRPSKIRFALLERAMKTSEIMPEWFNRMNPRDEFIDYFYGEKFYQLKYLDRDSLYQLMDNIAETTGSSISTSDKNSIYDQALKIAGEDNEASPLYTILLTDACLNGKTITTMNQHTLMKYVIEKDEEYWCETLCNHDLDLFESFKKMLIYATAVGKWNFKVAEEPLKEASTCLTDRFQRISRRKEVFGDFLDDQQCLKALEPDVIGEYYVVEYLLDIYGSEEYSHLIKLFGKSLKEFNYFLFRCTNDYLWQKRYEQIVLGEFSIFNSIDKIISAMLLANITALQTDIEYVKRIVSEFKKYADESEDMAVMYARVLFNLSNKQDKEERTQTVKVLWEVYEAHKGNEKIGEAYARGLFNLTLVQDKEESEQTIKVLREVYEVHKGNEEICIQYAKGLCDLSRKQDKEECEQTIKVLREVYEAHEGNEVLCEVYALGLCFLLSSIDHIDKDETQEIIDRLMELRNLYPDNMKIQEMYEDIKPEFEL